MPQNPITPEEKIILSFLKNGLYDGSVGKSFYDEYGNIVGFWIMCGIPTKSISSLVHASRYEEVLRYHDPRIIKEYSTDKQKLHFLKRYGHYVQDELVQSYSINSGLASKLPNYPRPQAHSKEVPYTEIEQHLLERLATGAFDDFYGAEWADRWSEYYCTIDNGTPIRWKQKKSSRSFDMKESEVVTHDPHILRKYVTDNEKLLFFAVFGRDIPDEEAIQYSLDNKKKPGNE